MAQWLKACAEERVETQVSLLRCQAALDRIQVPEWEQPLLIGLGAVQALFLLRYLAFSLYLARGRDAPAWMLWPEM